MLTREVIVTLLTERKKKILKTIIDDYISTAMPVGSKTIAEHMGMNVSSATVRSEMNELESMGYLDQPHTSAGRIPSDKAFRMYVDSLLEMANLSAPEMDYACDYYDERMVQTESILQSAARAISEATDYASVVMAPRLSAINIRHIQLVPLSPNTALVILVTDAGIIKDTPVTFNHNTTPEQLDDISRVLNKMFAGRSITEADLNGTHDITQEVQEQRELFTQVTDILRDHLLGAGDDVMVGGAVKLLNHPEYNDVGRAKEMLALLDSKEKLHDAIDEKAGVEFQIKIGSENEESELQDCAVVTATYKVGDKTAGTIGVIGPVRMQYEKVLKVLSYMKESLSEVLSQPKRQLTQQKETDNEQKEAGNK